MPIIDYIKAEQERQNSAIELIASENFVSDDVLHALGSCLTNKYSEGYPDLERTGNRGRYYGGCQYIDQMEQYVCNLYQELFQTNYHVNVQPHSGSQANMAAYRAILRPGATILSMSLDEGAHLTHGSPVSFSGKDYRIKHYHVDAEGWIDYDDVREKAILYKPDLIIAGASAYPRIINFQKFRKIADEVGAYLMVDMAHIAGLVATGLHPSPFEAGADIVTTTTHKILRGGRGGIIFCRPVLAKKVDSAVFPGIQGGPLQNVIAAKGVCAEEALKPSYYRYCCQVVQNAKAMADEFEAMGYDVITGGTDNHLLLLDLRREPFSGADLQNALDRIGITLNKNCVPGDERSPKETSGVRIGTPAMTTKGYKEQDFIDVAHTIDRVVQELRNELQK